MYVVIKRLTAKMIYLVLYDYVYPCISVVFLLILFIAFTFLPCGFFCPCLINVQKLYHCFFTEEFTLLWFLEGGGGTVG